MNLCAMMPRSGQREAHYAIPRPLPIKTPKQAQCQHLITSNTFSLVPNLSMPKINIELPSAPTISSKFRESLKANVGTPDRYANRLVPSCRSPAPLGRRQSVTLAQRGRWIKRCGTRIANSERHCCFVYIFRAPLPSLFKSLLSLVVLQARTAATNLDNGSRCVP